MHRIILHLLAIITVALVPLRPAQAAWHVAYYCVGSSSDLDVAFKTVIKYSSIGGILDEIRIPTGTYAAPTGGWTSLNTPAALGALTISGGWNADCSAQTPDARRTVLDGRGADPVLNIYFNQDLALANLTLARGRSINASNSCLSYYDNSGGAVVDLENIIASGCTSSQSAGAIYLGNPLYVTVRGLLSINNSAANNASLYIYQSNGSGLVRISQSTFAGNMNTMAAGSIVKIDSQAPVFLSNDALLYNRQPGSTPVTDFHLMGPALATFKNSVYGTVYLPAGTLQSSNVAVGGTQFIFMGPNDFRSARGTPMRNGGSNFPDGGALQYDVFGGPRVLEGAMDIGALESDALFAGGFESSL